MPKSRNSVLAALALHDNGISVIESMSHVAAVKITRVPQSKLTLITSKALPGADSKSTMSDASSTCSPIDNSSMDSLHIEEVSARSGRSDDRNEDGPRTRSSSRRRSLESKKRASQKKNKKRREREAAAKRKLLGTAMSDASPLELPSPTSPTSPSDMSDHSTTASTAELDMDHAKEDDLDDIEEREQEQEHQITPHDGKKDDHKQDKPISIASEPLPSIQAENQTVSETNNFDTSAVELEAIPEEQQELDETIDETKPEAMEKEITVKEIKTTTTENDQDEEKTKSTVEDEPEEQQPQPETPSQDDLHNNDNNISIQNQRVISNESISNLPSWDAASETVATVAIQCLTRDKDMELSYVAILSAVTVLQGDRSASKPSTEEAKEKVASMYDRLFSIMCGGISKRLDKETAQQGAMAPDALYSLLYNAVLQAGYQLKLETHLLIAKYLIHHKRIEEARECITRIDQKHWTGPVYRAAIVCFLFSKSRQLQEAESVLENYIDYQERSTTDQDHVDQAARNWFKLQLDASKWEDIKIQYERRRARLVDAPSNIDRFLQNEDNRAKSPQERQQSPQRQFKHERSASAASPITSPASSHQRSPSAQLSSPSGHQRTLSGHQRTPSGVMPSWPSGASATLNASPTPASVTKGPFSFLASLKFTAKADANNTKSSDTSLPSRVHANRHLTVLDNGMLEDCIRHKEYEYGWKHIYERMGPSLEDSETSKIVMRMCMQAFMSHSRSQSGSPNMTTKDMVSEDEIEATTDLAEEMPLRRRDPEIWEARAWAVYNKAMMNPHTFTVATQSTSSANTTSTTAMFFHDILTVAICSPETSSRFLKAFKVYSTLRSDPHNQQLLRDPFVMSCMIKAVYDAVSVVINNPEQQPTPASSYKCHHRRSSSLSLNRSQPMTLGPLMDLAFEIYADMRNVGSIRHLPSLINLAPTSPTGRSRRNSALFGSPAPVTQPTPILASDSAEDSEDKASTASDSPRPSFTAITIPAFQDLNPTLKPNSQAKRLPTEIYLALLHLCIQVPVLRMSSQVVKTILDDMKNSSGRQSSVNLDRHLAAALQQYHDTWLCDVENKAACVYLQWMYKPETFVQEHGKDKDGEFHEAKSEVPLEGLEGIECNEQFYWDLWSAEDEQLKNVVFTQQRVDMLVKHIAALL
ncbi:hypothetical protein BGZ82_007581 [Podila clonocystis]|nr:hypothetical protein BGZ82_007581 [Podila clonocystis]